MRATATLTEADLAALDRESWIDVTTADAFGLFRVTSAQGAALVGRTDREDYAGIVFPTYFPGQDAPREYLIRRDHPPLEQRNGSLKPMRKYLAPPGRGNILLFGPGESADVLTDTSLPWAFAEGIKKQVAGYRFSRVPGMALRVLMCGVTGAWNFRGTIGKTTNPTGARVSIKGIIPDLDRVTWTDRIVFLLYDSDAATNPKVSAAREALAEELRSRGARVVIMFIPSLDGLETTGFDNLLARWGAERVENWLQAGLTGVTEVEDSEPISLDPMVVPAFPTSVIPVAWLRDMVDAMASATETPVELALLMGLAATATTIQKKYIVAPEPDYTEPLNIWASVFLDSGNRKSAVLKAMTAPLLEFEKQHAALHAPDVARRVSARRLAEERIKHLRQKAAKADGLDADALRHELFDEETALPVVPTTLRLWTQDVTPEKLGQLMEEQNETMSLFSDEGGLFSIFAGRYSQGVPNLDLLLKAHSGSPYRVDRTSRPAVFMENPCLTIAISPQPDVLRGLAKIPGFRERGGCARLLYAIPRSSLGSRTLDAHPVPEDILANYVDSVYALLRQTPQADGRPHTLLFSEDALHEWKAFQRHVEDELGDGGAFEHIRDWASKLPGACARLAGILHCADHARGAPHTHPINLPTMEAALALGVILERHALAAFSVMAVDSSLDAAGKVWSWVLRHKHGTFSRRDCFHALKGSFPDMATIQPAFETLIERGYLFPLPIVQRVGRPSQSYRVNHHIAKEWT